MQNDTALLFQFPDEAAAALASDTMQELGYDPVIRQNREVHIHLHGSDLTSALEIAQALGGQLAVNSPIGDNAAFNIVYDMDAIRIPAHVVNEDWVAREERPDQPFDGAPLTDGASYNDPHQLTSRDEGARDETAFIPDAGDYNHFSGDVHT
ncbi:hypothetical protein KZ483_07030 [Paenibacillus sp. sptzw28]|uniref:hypothetical protein n=1 Tax=Paenibacillus sp. sptzw28 TaxID=715179 RepID=UPI001C6EC63D|nr:hypothetical protein [Paenibacillus sp. sptzw28]QYR22694.1 hypothetical protein KZ483_07030 [Paenibacillus sp. sptzw28]